jgi:thioredoxin 1
MKTKKALTSMVVALFVVIGTCIPMQAQASTVKLSESNFDNTISSGTTVVDFYADWCGPCKSFAPTFEKVSNEVQGVTFGKVNVDQNRSIMNKFGIQSIPTIILIKDGKEVKRNVGPMSYNTFKNFVSGN